MNRVVDYGTTKIAYKIIVRNLENHYITVSTKEGVILKGQKVTEEEADKLVLMRASWIMDKLDKVSKGIDQSNEEIVTGSRIFYMGKRYFAEVKKSQALRSRADVSFKYNRFQVIVSPLLADPQKAIQDALNIFYLAKAKEKLPKRFKHWQAITGLKPLMVRYRQLQKRWGGCSEDDEITINAEVMKLPGKVIDYIIVHELCHIVHKNHSKEFWKLVKKYLPDYQEIHDELGGMKL